MWTVNAATKEEQVSEVLWRQIANALIGQILTREVMEAIITEHGES